MTVKLTQKIRETSRRIAAEFFEYGEQTCRRLAERLGCSKSAAHRHEQARKQRDQHPESWFWETEEGYDWLRRLIFGTIYIFGIQRSVGAGCLSEYFAMLRIDTHVGISETALRTLIHVMENLLPAFQKMCEAQYSGASLKAVLAGDETFFGQEMLLVLIELTSGYLLLEESADDRSYETWLEKAKPRLEALDIEVVHAVTDRAKALVKLATDGFGCDSGADVFHAVHEVSKALGAAHHRSVEKAKREAGASQAKLEKLQEKNAGKAELEQARRAVEQDTNRISVREQGQKIYQQLLRSLSEIVHPFSVEGSAQQSSAQAAKRLEEQARKLEDNASLNHVEDRKGGLDKFRRQISAQTCGIDVWWIWVLESLSDKVAGTEQKEWLMYSLLPVFYWYLQMEKSQNAHHRKKYKQAWQRALADYLAHSMTSTLSSEEREQWEAWADWMSSQFHRSSSAVEGRNGCLSQMYHNGRGLTKRRLKALTVIHNYGIKRSDGTTAAERFFGTEFPDLFEWLMEQMGDLPLPRKGKSRVVSNPLNLQLCPGLSG